MFAVFHFQSLNFEALFRAAFLLVVGLWLGYFFNKTKSLWPPIIIHSIYNLSTALFV
jgi:membrane protease YdiL (CAAX protease family)